MKLRFGLAVLFLICVTLFAACNRGVATEQPQTSTASSVFASDSAKADTWIPENDTEEGFSAGFDPSGHLSGVNEQNAYEKILAGDLSDFAGVWINGRGNISELTSGGLFDGGYYANNFKKTVSGVNEIYSWWVSFDGDGGEVRLYPAGTEVLTMDDRVLQTDTTKVRIAVYPNSSDQVYYQEGEYPNIPRPVPVELASGTFINGFIEKGEEQWYVVRTPDWGILTVETEGSTDTVLTAYTDSYEYLSENDDTWTGDYLDHNARLVISVRPDTVYIFKLSSFESGPYRILAIFELGLG